jgi:hypothetical protein
MRSLRVPLREVVAYRDQLGQIAARSDDQHRRGRSVGAESVQDSGDLFLGGELTLVGFGERRLDACDPTLLPCERTANETARPR